MIWWQSQRAKDNQWIATEAKEKSSHMLSDCSLTVFLMLPLTAPLWHIPLTIFVIVIDLLQVGSHLNIWMILASPGDLQPLLHKGQSRKKSEIWQTQNNSMCKCWKDISLIVSQQGQDGMPTEISYTVHFLSLEYILLTDRLSHSPEKVFL